MLFKQVTQSSKIVKRGRSRLKNPLSALAIAAAAAAATAAAIPRTFTFEPRTSTPEASPFPSDPLTKRLLMLTTVKALKYIKCINNKIISRFNRNCYNCDTSVIRCLRCAKGSYSNCTAASAAANTAFDNFVSAKDNSIIQKVRRSLRDAMRQQLALDAVLLKGAASSLDSLANRSRGFRSSPDSLTSFALALKTFNLNIAFVKLNSLIAANRSPVTRSASSMSSSPLFDQNFFSDFMQKLQSAAIAALALTLAAFIAPVAPAAPVALIIVASSALIITLAVLAAAPAVAMTLAKRRAKVKRLLRALIDLLL
ncbi:hypothetical protein MBM_04209 [Drepanopeziza brunnea f. sp. 'multigermtubi' MB_m1]|uniref:Uncharacterized protein n=1 Tax=Marssonina brunnea f. sp. multigermtubi (strain MB_m1) TaxID=1072389 RepID=K1X9C4_MARBU|nr:uncharacterized protein MBM_04209 [Drepanopeziza brunnea f. sp. 'multigermtubi' MB_m1]EKD17348.1 hypothetical protein MBM_04209 [Drepanopeziza brunnea f. sp. 'multigermtubi' MB_m1]